MPVASQCHRTANEQHTDPNFLSAVEVAAKGLCRRANFGWLLSIWFLLLALQTIASLIMLISVVFPYCGKEPSCDKYVDEGVHHEGEGATGCLWPLKKEQYRGQLFVAVVAAASICVNISIGILSSFGVRDIKGFPLYKGHLLCAGAFALLNLAAGSVASWYTYDQKYLPTIGCHFYKQWVVSTISAFVNFLLYATDFIRRTVVLLKK